MLINRILLFGIDILLSGFSLYLFYSYFDIFFEIGNEKISLIMGAAVFLAWQLVVPNNSMLPVYVNIGITTIVTMLAALAIYDGQFWKKCIFAVSFNAIWMLIEILSGDLLLIYCKQLTELQEMERLGSFVSKLLFLFVIISLKMVFMNDDIKDLSVKYSLMLVLIPTGSIFIMNNIFTLCYKVNSNRANFNSAITAIMLLCMNVLIFYIYMKLADDLRLRRMTSAYEQQLELCERHLQEREISILQLRDVKHNMKNNLVSILAHAENGECDKIISFVYEIMEEGAITTSAITNSGNIVIDSLVGYWYTMAQKAGIDFFVDVSIPMKMPFKGADLCLILGNLLENAVEGAKKAEGEKYIRLHMKYDKRNLLLFMVNSYSGRLIKAKGNVLKSTKQDAENHGIGLLSVNRAAAKYHGTVVIEDSVQGEFFIKVVLYGEQE